MVLLISLGYLGGKHKTEENEMSDKKSTRGRGERIWEQTDPAATVESPLDDWVKAEPERLPRLRVTTLINDSLYQVVDHFGNTWEVSREADGALAIIRPDDVSRRETKRVLGAIQRETRPDR